MSSTSIDLSGINYLHEVALAKNYATTAVNISTGLRSDIQEIKSKQLEILTKMNIIIDGLTDPSNSNVFIEKSFLNNLNQIN